MHKAQAAALNAANIANFTKKPGDKEQNQPTYKKMIFPFYKQLDETNMHNTLEFDSVFESGNLGLAIRVDENEYNLLL